MPHPTDGVTSEQLAACLHQQLFTLVQAALLPELLVSIAHPDHRVRAALPRAWRDALREEGVQTDRWRGVRWGCFVVRALLRGIKMVAALAASRRDAFDGAWRGQTIVYDATIAMFQSTLTGAPLRDLGASLELAGLGTGRIHLVEPEISTPEQVAGGRLTRSASPFPALRGRARMAFGFQAMGLVVRAAVDLARAGWSAAVLLSSQVEAAYAARCMGWPEAVVVTNSHPIARPLWTTVVEARTTRVVLLYYSVNDVPFTRAGILPSAGTGECLFTWPEVVTPAAEQGDRVRANARSTPAVTVVEHVDLTDSDEQISVGEPSCAVFDVAPQRLETLAVRGILNPYYWEGNISCFLRDVVDALCRHGVSPVLKQKRALGPYAVEEYVALVDQLSSDRRIDIVPTSSSARRLIDATNVTISFPFTTPSMYALRQGRPAIYYDPTGDLARTVPTRFDVPVISGPEALDEWVRSALSAGKVRPVRGVGPGDHSGDS